MPTNLFEDTTRQAEVEALFEDLIESAFLAGIITGETESLIYEWIRIQDQATH